MEMDTSKLRKISQEPAARLLSRTATKLEVKHGLPASASVADLLAELARQGETIAILRLLSVALPHREAVHWACLAAGDIARGLGSEMPTLKTAKAWVQRPDADAHEAVTAAMDAAENDDDTVYTAMAAHFAGGSMAVEEGGVDPSPPAGVGAMVVTQIMLAIRAGDVPFEAALDHMIRRGLDIAGGGTGQVAPPTSAEETV